MTESDLTPAAFGCLGLSLPVLRGLRTAGYTQPTPIQERTIPIMLEGKDLVGQAQTGTGKTAAFGLPLLSRLTPDGKAPQALILAPTRELAIQVADTLAGYAKFMRGVSVTAIYGGADFGPQLRALKSGADVVVGTPGRVMDHMRRGTLDLGNLTTLVLDEADEMLRMGFIDDVEWILEQTPPTRQIALFSATMPAPIRRIAQKYLREPAIVTIQSATATVSTIRQRHYYVRQAHKIDALVRILECEEPEGVVVFVRTRNAAVEVADALVEAGFSAAALNGDIAQKTRQRTVESLRDGALDIVVATDVAARGLDVSRVSHVINFDMPQDAEVYVHRIGRTGRAGRQGETILLLTPGQERQLRAIERFTRQRTERFMFPTRAELNARRIAKIKTELTNALTGEGLDAYEQLVSEVLQDTGATAEQLAAALARRLGGNEPLFMPVKAQAPAGSKAVVAKPAPVQTAAEQPAPVKPAAAKPAAAKPAVVKPAVVKPVPPASADDGEELPLAEGMDRYRVEVGTSHGADLRALRACISKEAGLATEHIGRVDIREEFTLVELPEGMPKEILRALKRSWVAGRQLRMRRLSRGKARTPHAAAR